MAPTAVAQADLTQVERRPIKGRPDAGYVPPPRSQGTVQQGALVGASDAQDSGQQAANPNNAGIAARISSLNTQLGPLQAQYEKAKREDPSGTEALRLEREIKRLQAEIEQLFKQIQAGPSQDQRQGAQPAAPSAEAAREAIRARQAPDEPSVEAAKQSIQDWEDGNRPTDVRTAPVDPAEQETPARSKRRGVKTPREAATGPAVSPDDRIYRPGETARLRSQTTRATNARTKKTSGEYQVAGTAPQQQR